jgi:hypothetical protein
MKWPPNWLGPKWADSPKKVPPLVSANTHLKEMLQALDKWGRIEEPSSGTTLPITGGLGCYNGTSGTRKLGDVAEGAMVLVSSTGELNLTTTDGTHIATTTAGKKALCISLGDGDWLPHYLYEPDARTEDELQSRLDNDVTNQIPVLLGTGGLTVTETIDIDGGYGGKIEGAGGSPPANSVQTHQSSYLQWNGPRTGSDAMIRLRRGDFTMREVGLYGDLKTAITDGVPGLPTDGNIGILFSKETSIGTGKFHGEGLVFSNWDTAIQISTAAAEANCDESLWTYNTFWRCDKAFRQLSQQSLGHMFVHPHFHEVDCCYELLGGGNITIVGGLYGYSRTNVPGVGNQGAAFIRLKSTTTDEFGPNSGMVVSDCLKVDRQARGVRLLDMDEVATPVYGGIKIRFNNLQIPYDSTPGSETWEGPMFYLSGNTHLIIDGASLLYEDAIRWDVDAGTLCTCTVINCVQVAAATSGTYADTFDTGNSTGDLVVNYVNNISGTARIANFNNTITGTG